MTIRRYIVPLKVERLEASGIELQTNDGALICVPFEEEQNPKPETARAFLVIETRPPSEPHDAEPKAENPPPSLDRLDDDLLREELPEEIRVGIRGGLSPTGDFS